MISKGVDTYGPGNYMKRAVVVTFGLPAYQEKDAVYGNTERIACPHKMQWRIIRLI